MNSPNADLSKKIEDLQILEHSLQQILQQKQILQIEINEIENAITEISRSKGEVYKIIGGVMVQSGKEDLSKELNDKKKTSELKIEAIEKQEKLLAQRATDLKKEIDKIVSSKKG